MNDKDIFTLFTLQNSLALAMFTINILQSNHGWSNMKRPQVTDLKDTVTEEENEELNGKDVLLPLTYTPHRSRSELFVKSTERKRVRPASPNVYTPTPDIMR
jgi:hypothetical protein